MPTIISHAILPLAAAVIAGPKLVPARVAWMGAALAMLPDLDVIGFRFGVPYGADWGHRGASHSLAIAALIAGLLALARPGTRRGIAVPFLILAMASHGLLDMLTDGGRGVALLWPASSERLFMPFRPIHVSPIGARFFSQRGLETVWSELLWIGLPCLIAAGFATLARRKT